MLRAQSTSRHIAPTDAVAIKSSRPTERLHLNLIIEASGETRAITTSFFLFAAPHICVEHGPLSHNDLSVFIKMPTFTTHMRVLSRLEIMRHERTRHDVVVAQNFLCAISAVIYRSRLVRAHEVTGSIQPSLARRRARWPAWRCCMVSLLPRETSNLRRCGNDRREV